MPANRVVAYIDGYNLYHGLIDARLRTSRWLDLRAMCKSQMQTGQQLEFVRCFTTRVRNDPKKSERQSRFVDAIEGLGGVLIDYGYFQSKVVHCHSCGHSWKQSEEKKTDINIAVRLLEDAHDDKFDTAILISGDGDLAPAIQSVRSRTPEKRVVVAFPPKRNSFELQRAAHAHKRISRTTILSCHLPATVTTSSGQVIKAPDGWLPKPGY